MERSLQYERSVERRAFFERELALPPFPAPLAYLWSWFLRLHRRRGSTGFAALPVSWADLTAFERLAGVRLTPWEVEVLESLDDAFRTAMAKQIEDSAAK